MENTKCLMDKRQFFSPIKMTFDEIYEALITGSGKIVWIIKDGDYVNVFFIVMTANNKMFYYLQNYIEEL